jgi:diguanylate cyclase (GGDEF)-like protein
MAGTRRTIGLGSRVALRTYLLFCLCSIAPVVLFAAFGYTYVNDELHRAAQARLAAASKRYGVLLFERLDGADQFLAERARLSLRSAISPSERTLSSERVRVLSIEEAPPGTPASTALEIVNSGGAQTVHLRVTQSDGERALTIVGEPVPEYLWNVDATDTIEVAYCVYADPTHTLHCTDGDVADDATPDRLVGQWHLYLRARFGADEWIVRAAQPMSAGTPELHGFKTTLLISAALAIGIALLLSSIQIRRSHRPLALLVAAAKQMGRGHLAARVAISGHDEYAGLGRAFNRMAENLRRQFHLLSAFARIDRLMLARPAVEPVIESLLPKARKLLHAETAAIIVRETSSGDARLYTATASGLALTRVHVAGDRLDALARASGKWLPASVVASDELQSLDDERLRLWNVASIRVGTELRGLLLLGFRARPVHSGRVRRHVSSLAHRIAVALGNEDREHALMRQAYYDSLTGLPNRQLFRDRLDLELARARRTGTSVALLFIDLDRYKTDNDSLGHRAGDELLQAVAGRLATMIGETRTLARLGGDEFTIIAPVPGVSAAGVLAAQILEVLKAPMSIGGMQCFAQASVGIAMFPDDGATAEMLIRNADTAMYKAKSLGRGMAVFFEDKMNAHALRRLQVEQRLRVALAQDSLEQQYQLKVHASDASPAGYEALARWTDAELGPVSPMEFIAVAEESGMVAQLDRWSLRTACRNARRWHDLGLHVGHIAVNVSLRHLDQTFVDFLSACLAEYGVPSGALELEITESTLAERPDETGRLLAAIRALGVRIAIDDFGTGYSSMAVLQRMPVDILKIDRAFVVRCAESDDAAALLKAMISVARGLRKEVVAEGVETPAQAALLRTFGCQYLQGFLFARPVTAATIEQNLAAEETRQRA